MTPPKTVVRKKYARQDTDVEKAHLALFWKGHIISGPCRFVGKKYADGQVIFEITYTTELPTPISKKKR